ncbi:MAG: glycerophosphodiester phosphodiesterase [Gemmatimonadota bacterium]|nr:glycerophosphodiester phosphodiesterase [Gemmatimonadota bacterium]
MDSPLVIAHRGASGYALENSIAAFREAAARGADGIELDVHATVDGGFVVHHDPGIGGLGAIADVTAERLRSHRLSNGEPIPTLSDALAASAGLDVWVEVKRLDPRWDAALLEVLDGGPTPGRYAVHSFDHRIVSRLGERDPGRRRGVLLGAYLVDPVTAVHAADADTLWMQADLIDGDLVETMAQAGLAVIAWTVNSEVEVRRLTALGVHAICGNYPDLIRENLAPHA